MKLRYENIRKKSVDKSMDKLLTNSGQSGQTLLLLKKGLQKQNGNVEKFMEKASYPHTYPQCG